MARQVKCRWCEAKQQFDEETMMYEESVAKSGRRTKKFFHKICFEEHQESQKSKKVNKPVVCRWCLIEERFDEETMMYVDIYSEKGNRYRKYFHKDCFPKAEEEDKFKRKEEDELDDLMEMIADVHNITVPNVPRQLYSLLQDIRNGTNRYRKKKKIRFKDGVSYPVIKEAYRLSKDDIRWARMNKQFKKLFDEMRYGLAIVHNRIGDAMKAEINRKRQEALAKAREKEMEDLEDEQTRGVKYKKDETSYDISAFLD